MSNIKYKDYLEHEIKVKFADGVLERSQDWQWFINYIEENYNLSDIDDYSDFKNNRSSPIIRILGNFLNILKVCETELHFDNLLLYEVFLISKYKVGAVERKICCKKIKTNFCKILLLLVWLTKLQNSGNNTKYIVDSRFINQRNFHQAIKMESFDYDKEDIFSYIKQINVSGFDQAKQNIEDNLNKIVYDVSEGFFEKYADNLLSVNCFSYQSFEREAYLTWQEHTLLDMLSV